MGWLFTPTPFILKRVKTQTCKCGNPTFCRGMCVGCHSSWKWQNDFDYREKDRLKSKRWREDNPDKCREYAALKRIGPERRALLRLLKKRCRVRNETALEGIRRRQRRKQGMLNPHGKLCQGPCASCGIKEAIFVLDHDHSTGVIRGELCHGCNSALGMLKDSLANIMGLYNYLRQHTKEP